MRHISFLFFLFLGLNCLGQTQEPSGDALMIPMQSDRVSLLFNPNNSVAFDEDGIKGTSHELTISLGDIDFGQNAYNRIWVEMAYTGAISDESAFEFYLDNDLTQPDTQLDIPLKDIPVEPYESADTPQSGLFFKNQPAGKVYAFDLRKEDNISKMICAAAQGIINQQTAQAYLIFEDHLLDQLNDADIDYEIVPNYNHKQYGALGALLNTFQDRFSKILIWDEEKEWTWCLAQMIAAQQKGLPVTATVKDFLLNDLKLNIPVEDLRNQWTGKLEAYQWAIDNLSANCHNTLSFSAGLRSDYKSNPWRIYDYATASKGFVFWLDEKKAAEKAMIGKIFTAMDYQPGSATMGYGFNGDELNDAINPYNTGFMVSDYYSNGSFWCAFQNKSFRQRKGQAIEAQPGKIYVSIIWSDGDNVQFDANQLYRMIKYGKRRGEVPTGITMASVLQELNPALLDFFYKNLTPMDELVAGPSGFQFIYGDKYNANTYASWLEMNRIWLQTAGFRTVCLWNTAIEDRFEQYMSTCNLQGIFDGWSKYQYKYQDGVVVLNQGAHCWKEGDVFDDLKKAVVNPNKPVFRNVYLIAANYGGIDGYERLIRELERMESFRPNTYVYLLPMDLCATLANYLDEHGGTY